MLYLLIPGLSGGGAEKDGGQVGGGSNPPGRGHHRFVFIMQRGEQRVLAWGEGEVKKSEENVPPTLFIFILSTCIDLKQKKENKRNFQIQRKK